MAGDACPRGGLRRHASMRPDPPSFKALTSPAMISTTTKKRCYREGKRRKPADLFPRFCKLEVGSGWSPPLTRGLMKSFLFNTFAPANDRNLAHDWSLNFCEAGRKPKSRPKSVQSGGLQNLRGVQYRNSPMKTVYGASVIPSRCIAPIPPSDRSSVLRKLPFSRSRCISAFSESVTG